MTDGGRTTENKPVATTGIPGSTAGSGRLNDGRFIILRFRRKCGPENARETRQFSGVAHGAGDQHWIERLFLRRITLSETIDSAPLDAEEASQLREKLYNATIIERIDAHSELARFRIRPDIPIPPFKPGQYVALGVGNWEPRLEGTQPEEVPEKNLRKLARRAYSISCPMIGPDQCVAPVDSIDYLEFYITLVRSADSPDKKPPVLTPRLFNMTVGDRIEVQKKITGNYTLEACGTEDTILMLGTGTGEAPHNAMVATLLAGNHRGRIVNVTSVRHRADLAYAIEHATLMKRYPQYRYLPFTTRDPENLDPSHPAYVGKQYLQDLLVSGRLAEAAGVEFSPANTHVFLCGNPAMIGYVPPGADLPEKPGMLPILRQAGFSDKNDSSGPGTIRFEKYW
jgi:ferredoxin--NADP+ reductase